MEIIDTLTSSFGNMLSATYQGLPTSSFGNPNWNEATPSPMHIFTASSTKSQVPFLVACFPWLAFLLPAYHTHLGGSDLIRYFVHLRCYNTPFSHFLRHAKNTSCIAQLPLDHLLTMTVMWGIMLTEKQELWSITCRAVPHVLFFPAHAPSCALRACMAGLCTALQAQHSILLQCWLCPSPDSPL